MEFNVLPRAKVLSPASSNKTKQTTNQTVNVIIPGSRSSTHSKASETADVDVPNAMPAPECPRIEDPNPYKDTCDVSYQTRDVNLEDPADTLTQTDAIATINFLRLVLEAYISNPIKYNGYVICSVPVLENMIETLTSCDDCNIDVADIDTGCCGTGSVHVIPIARVWVKNGDSTEPFKYKYPQFLQIFEQYHISLKFCFVN